MAATGGVLTFAAPSKTKETIGTTATTVTPRPFSVGDLTDPAAVATLRKPSQGLCGVPATIERRLLSAAEQAARGPISQMPSPDTNYACGLMLTIYRQPSLRPIIVGDLSQLANQKRLIGLARARCGDAFAVARQGQDSSLPPGNYLDQKPEAESVYNCGDTVTVYFAQARQPTPFWPYAAASGGMLVVAAGAAIKLRRDRERRRKVVYGVLGRGALLRVKAKESIPVMGSVGLIAGDTQVRVRAQGMIRGLLGHGGQS